MKAPQPSRFLLSPLNAADMLALLPFYLELALRQRSEPGAPFASAPSWALSACCGS